MSLAGGATLTITPNASATPVLVEVRVKVTSMSETDEKTTPHIIPAGEAARELGVSVSGLRRLIVIYEEVHGELPRKGAKGRMRVSSRLRSSSG